MAQPALSNQMLEDLESLSDEVRQQVEDMVHAMVEGASPEQLRFQVDDPSISGTMLRAVAPDAAPDVLLAEIRTLLSEGQVLMARRLAAAAAKHHPDHAEIGQADRVLNAGGSRIVASDPAPNTDEEFAWLRQPPA